MSTLGFFAIVLVIFYILPQKFRWGVLLLASIIFYASADWKMLALIAGSIGISYYAGLQMEKAEDAKKKRSWMSGCIVILVAILMVFKYYGFFAEQIGKMLGASSFVFKLVMPLGFLITPLKSSVIWWIFIRERSRQKSISDTMPFMSASFHRLCVVRSREQIILFHS